MNSPLNQTRLHGQGLRTPLPAFVRALIVLALSGPNISGLEIIKKANAAQRHVEQEHRKIRSFALIVGVNRAPASNAAYSMLSELRYADDDAARNFDLMRTLGATTRLLSDFDRNTKRLHPEAWKASRIPSTAKLHGAVAAIAKKVAQARQRGEKTRFYFFYAGHGIMRDGTGLLMLSDTEMSGPDIRKTILEPIHADYSHVVIDACHAFFLAHHRGPGGQRRAVHGFSKLQSAFSGKNTGILLSTSSAEESHEWAAIQAGLFSHELRSALYGAADVDRDGAITYREIAAFINRANATIPNERFRPQIYARPPQNDTPFVSVDYKRVRTVHLPGTFSGRYQLETALGVRLFDFHSTSDHDVMLIRPAVRQPLYLRRFARRSRADESRLAGGEHGRPRQPQSAISARIPNAPTIEYEIPAATQHVEIASLPAHEIQQRTRGAAHHAFQRTFELPFGLATVAGYQAPVIGSRRSRPKGFDPPLNDGLKDRYTPRWITALAWGSVGIGAASLAAGLAFTLSANGISNDATNDPDVSQRAVLDLNDRIETKNRSALIAYLISGLATAGGIGTLLWLKRGKGPVRGPAPANQSQPPRSHTPTFSITRRGAVFGFSREFE